ncbi:hypothetical protein Barb4_03772 [Bacteroidales bacterium Barb4]|nr:hypothetical protein Barb4_03772 [Bacteroidales bacterium Barb4]
MQAGTHIIVGRRTPEVRGQFAAFVEHGGTVCIVATHKAILSVKINAEVLSFYNKEEKVVVRYGGRGKSDVGQARIWNICRRGLVGTDGQLVLGNRMTGGQERFRLLQLERDVQQQFLFLVNAGKGVVELDVRLLLRSNGQVADNAALYGFAVGKQYPFGIAGTQVTEIMLVIDAYKTGGHINGCSPDGLVDVRHFVEVGIRLAVGIEKPVIAEVVVGGIVGVEVAAVAEIGFAVRRLGMQGLIDKVPNETALEGGILADEIPIVLEAALRVAHCVGVFAEDKRFGGVASGVFFTAFVVQVHRAVDVGEVVLLSLLVLHGTRGVFRFNPLVAGFKVGTETGFVAQRPDNNRGMIEIALHVALVAFQMGGGVERVLCQCVFAVHAVRFDVGFGYDVDAVFVAEVIPEIVVWIVAGADGVDVVLLHQGDVLNHPLARDGIAAVGVYLVAIGAFEEYGLPVDEYLPVLQLNLAEADVEGDGFQRPTAVLQGNKQLVEVGSFRRPFLGGTDRY